MKLEALELGDASIVVLSDSNNPRLLNPDFLRINKITPAEWKDVGVLVTPAIARVTYENGVDVLVEENKVQISATKPDQLDWDKEIPRMAKAYLELLPHVTYRAVGFNFGFRCVWDREDVGQHIAGKMLIPNPWLEWGNGVQAATIDVKYHVKDQMTWSLKVGSGIIIKGDQRQPALLINANLHHDFEPEDRADRSAFISDAEKWRAQLDEILSQLPLFEE